jgi:hypothetical protein
VIEPLPQIPLTKPVAKPQAWEPMLDKSERDRAFNLGHSLDSKKVTSALGYLDLKQICYCLAHALNKHIEFSQGFFFLGDLRDHHKQMEITGKELEFTYNLGDRFRVTLDKDKIERAKDKEDKGRLGQEESKKQFEEIKK